VWKFLEWKHLYTNLKKYFATTTQFLPSLGCFLVFFFFRFYWKFSAMFVSPKEEGSVKMNPQQVTI